MTSRPAETGGLAAALATLVARAAGVDDVEVITGLAIVAGALPAAITLVVANGGIRGAVARLWRGRA